MPQRWLFQCRGVTIQVIALFWQQGSNSSVVNISCDHAAKCVCHVHSVHSMHFQWPVLHLKIISVQQDECFCSKLGVEVEHAIAPNLKTSLSHDLGDLSLASFCQCRVECLWEMSFMVWIYMKDNDEMWQEHIKDIV